MGPHPLWVRDVRRRVYGSRVSGFMFSQGRFPASHCVSARAQKYCHHGNTVPSLWRGAFAPVPLVGPNEQLHAYMTTNDLGFLFSKVIGLPVSR